MFHGVDSVLLRKRGSWWENESYKSLSARINNAIHSRALTKEGQHNNIECT
jgi:hypothetical protein